MTPGAGEPDVDQVLLFIIGIGAAQAWREPTFGCLDDEDHIPLKTLGAVQGREHDPVGVHDQLPLRARAVGRIDDQGLQQRFQGGVVSV